MAAAEGATEGEGGVAEGVATAGGFGGSGEVTTAGGLGAGGEGTAAGRLEDAGGRTIAGGGELTPLKRWSRVAGSKIVIAKMDANTMKKTDPAIIIVR